ncbi:biotin-dependent carboxyltransferase family protein [Candidatus Deferrimicrobium sp.]|uniref:5-oxoprolinase subunit C family protein n=1 Tax=Candidatus Deferrimicrobium sp. TaxID=3060586 RepID=UPI002ED5CA35
MILVVSPGFLTTVQDEGRRGYRAFGMPWAGAMDRYAFAAANFLAGNPRGAAALEMTISGGSFRFEEPAYVALCGADMGAVLEGEPAGNWVAFPVASGATLSFGSAAQGCRAYLAVLGGFDVPVVLGSRSTYTRAGIGGFRGRVLAGGDTLRVGPAPAAGQLPPRRFLPRPFVPPCGGEARLRVLAGPQEEMFASDGIATFYSSPYTVTDRNDRMGYRLEGPTVRHEAGPDIITDAIVPGAVQVPGNGMPIVMMADCQTSGGYATIGTVIGPDLRLLAQARRGDTVRFVRCPEEAAITALREEHAAYAAIAGSLPGACRGR